MDSTMLEGLEVSSSEAWWVPSQVLDKRDCVVCTSKPTCPSCSDGYYCSYTVQSCDSCPEGICVASDDSSTATSTPTSRGSSSGSGVNTGAIAGGVVAGFVVFAAITAFLLWKYVYSAKAKANQLERERAFMLEQNNYDAGDAEKMGVLRPGSGDSTPGGPGGNGNANRNTYGNGGSPGGLDMPNNRYSSTTVSTVTNSNGDNVIPIAYIPGVISRAGADANNNPSDRYFVASDILRDSRYTDDIRSSIATTNYGGSVVFASEPVEVMEARPNLIHLDSGNNNNNTTSRNVGNLSIDTSRSLSTYSNSSEPITPIYIQSAQTFDTSQRLNARSVRLGRLRNTLGLQSQLIEEDPEAEQEDVPSVPSVSAALLASEKDKNDKKQKQEGPPALVSLESNDVYASPSGTQSRAESLSNASQSQNIDVRISAFSGFDVPFVIDGEEAESTKSNTNSRAMSNLTQITQKSSTAGSSSNSKSSSTRVSRNSEYIADLPLEAILNAQSALGHVDGDSSNESSNESSTTTRKEHDPSRFSPFDDKYVI